VRGRDDLVAGTDAQRFEREVQARGGRVDGRLSSPRKAVKACSNWRALGPVVTQPERKVSTTSAISSSPISGRAKGRKGSLSAAESEEEALIVKTHW
jgi:hypothetical protein